MEQRDIFQYKQFSNIGELISSIYIGQQYWIATSIFGGPADISGPFNILDIKIDENGLYIAFNDDDNVFNRHHVFDLQNNISDAIFTSEIMANEFVRISKIVFDNSKGWQENVRQAYDSFCSGLDSMPDWVEFDD